MPSKYEISTEAQVLLKLLRIALGTEPMASNGKPVEPFPQAIDWREVIRLSYEQKVSALAVDGLKASGYDIRQLADSADLQPAFASWLDDVGSSEESYAYYLTVLSTLCQIFGTNGLKPVILKGYGLSRDYPVPSHRGAGDIDIYLLDEDGKPAAERGDEILEKQLGLRQLHPEKSDEHHSVFVFKGINIENHHELVSTYFDKASDDTLRQSLFAILKPEREHKDSQIFFPSATFNAVYLLQHLYAHFYFGMVNIRQLVDLMIYLKKNYSNINWDEFNNVCKEGGLLPFFQGIYNVLRKYLYLDIEIPMRGGTRVMRWLVLDMFYYGRGEKFGLGKIRYYMLMVWHFYFFDNQIWINLTTKHIIRKVKQMLGLSAC